LLDFANHNEEAAKSILQSILKTQQDLAQELRLQLHQSDPSVLTPLCHKILGGAKLINAQFLINYCQNLQNSEKEFVQEIVHQIYQEIVILNKQMQDFLQLKNSYMI
jgi:HPt (histidine-containing phosphotransfer) domain-containing protein